VVSEGQKFGLRSEDEQEVFKGDVGKEEISRQGTANVRTSGKKEQRRCCCVWGRERERERERARS
jgi:hypothetical protein